MTYDEMVAKAKAMTDSQLHDARFINWMTDKWSDKDWQWDAVLWNEIMERRNAKREV